MTQRDENNHLYITMKHCNDFLKRQDDYRSPKNLKSIDESVRDFSESVNDNAFTHSGDLFKRAKESLRHKGQL